MRLEIAAIIWLEQDAKHLTCWTKGLPPEKSPVISISIICIFVSSIFLKSKTVFLLKKTARIMQKRANIFQTSNSWPLLTTPLYAEEKLLMKALRELPITFYWKQVVAPTHHHVWPTRVENPALDALGSFPNSQLVNKLARIDEEQKRRSLLWEQHLN